MKYRKLGKTNYKVSEIGFGAWAIGADWGKIDDKDSLKALHKAADLGVNFLDTADVYGNGHSEQLIAKFLKERRGKERIYIATKAGRRLSPHTADEYTGKNIERFIERSLKYLKTDSLDLLQLHCPPNDVYYNQELFEYLEKLKKKGKIRHFGVSVEKVEQAIKALDYPGVATVQIIFNIFRQRPKELFFKLAKEKNVGIVVRVPLASGLLTGKYNTGSKFSKNDHRNYNRYGEAFDVGETFAGVDFETGVKAVRKLEKIKPKNMSMPQFALRFILDHREVSTAIPGGKTPEQVIDNTKASNLKPLSGATYKKIVKVYNDLIEPQVHNRW
ncbi:MAG: aldo/keto reductase [Candidatus Levybacteria bacterium CG10_big_fil_rev_8_21_14_0_10_35_13]|nr:MAG: aldo/keto reductase [Candidatus Levybacteria bacterium CG10_big_fil_rev_8_21_14_0_10_35_13]